MRTIKQTPKHTWKIVIAGAVLTGIFLFATNTHRTTQAAAPATVHGVASTETPIEFRPINAVDSTGGGGDLDAMNKTD